MKGMNNEFCNLVIAFHFSVLHHYMLHWLDTTKICFSNCSICVYFKTVFCHSEEISNFPDLVLLQVTMFHLLRYSLGKAWSRIDLLVGLSKERPILGDHAKAHIHEIRQISHEIQWISCENLLANLINQIIQEKLFSFMQCSGKAMSQDFTKIYRISWNPLNFMWNPPDFERPTIARNGKAYVFRLISSKHYSDCTTDVHFKRINSHIYYPFPVN